MQFNLDNLGTEAQQRITELKTELTSTPSLPIKLNFRILGMITGAMDNVLTRDGRLSFWKWLYAETYGFEVSSSHDLRVEDLYKIQQWADPRKVGNEWAYSTQFYKDLKMIASGLIETVATKEEEISHE